MATLAVQNVSTAAISPTYTVADVGGDRFRNDGKTLLHVLNAGAEITLTVPSALPCNRHYQHQISVVIPATTGDMMIGPFAIDRYNDRDGYCQITYSGVAGLTIAIAALNGLLSETLSEVGMTSPYYDGPFILMGPHPWIDPLHTYYGAVGDGVTDDTAALQNAINDAIAQGEAGQRGGKIRLADGKTYSHTGLVLSSGSEQYVSVNLVGGSGKTTRLRYDGANDGIALWIQGLLDYHMENFWIDNGIDRETTTGVLIDDITGSGTQSGQGVWTGVRISGFDTGIKFGDATSTSELTFLHCEFRDCTTGVWYETFNTLNIHMLDCSCNGNDYGYYIHHPGALQWIGGAVGENTVADFYFDSNSAGSYLISGIRSENSDRFLINRGGSEGAWVQLIACDAQPSTNVDDILIDAVFGSHMTFQGCHIRGKVLGHNSNPQYFDFTNTFVRGPQLVHPRSSSLEGVSVVARNSQLRAADETTVDLPIELAQIGQADGSLLTVREVTDAGLFSAPGLRLTTAPVNGYVLTSDADGDATWQVGGRGADRAALWGLVSAWGLADLSDSYGVATLTNNGTATFNTGHLGNAVYLTRATPQWLTRPAEASPGDVDFMVSAWVYLTDETLGPQTVIAQSNGTLFPWDIYYQTNRFRWYVERSGDSSEAVANTFGAVSPAVWHLVIGVHDAINNLISISVNGGAWDSVAHSGGVRTDSIAMGIGATATGTEPLGGRIDAIEWMVAPPGGIAAVQDAIRDFRWNGGTGREYAGAWG